MAEDTTWHNQQVQWRKRPGPGV